MLSMRTALAPAPESEPGRMSPLHTPGGRPPGAIIPVLGHPTVPAWHPSLVTLGAWEDFLGLALHSSAKATVVLTREAHSRRAGTENTRGASASGAAGLLISAQKPSPGQG